MGVGLWPVAVTAIWLGMEKDRRVTCPGVGIVLGVGASVASGGGGRMFATSWEAAGQYLQRAKVSSQTPTDTFCAFWMAATWVVK